MRRPCLGEWLVAVTLLSLPGHCTGMQRKNNPKLDGNEVISEAHSRLLLQTGPADQPVNNTVYDCKLMDIQGPFMKLSLTANLVLSNVTFKHCPAGALSLSPANTTTTSLTVTLLNSTFINNTAASSTTTSDATTSFGGALSISGSIVARLIDCSFQNNTAVTGAAVYSTAGGGGGGGAAQGGSLELVGCSFRGNRGQGAVAVVGGVLAGVSASNFSFQSGGSALYLSKLEAPEGISYSAAAEVEIEQVVFSDNVAGGSSSSASTSTSTAASSSGGGLLLDQAYVPVLLTNCTFTRNYATSKGGAIALSSVEKPVTLRSVAFSGNSAGLYGGALAASGSSEVAAVACNFSANTATQGGAVFVTAMSLLDLSSCILTNNTASKFGGAISAATGAIVTSSGTTFLRNQASFAGALECWNCNYLTLNTSSFLFNHADASAGALVVYAAAGPVTLSGNTFRSNQAGLNASNFAAKDCSRSSFGAGGAVCASLTHAMELSGNIFAENSATSGGALFVTRECEVEADDSSCTATELSLYDDNLLYNNTAVGGAGGALYALNISAVSISCSEYGRRTTYSASNLTTKWPYGAVGCNGTWVNNTATNGGYGPGLATGLAGLREAIGAGSSRANVSSNSVLQVVLQLYDFLGTAITRGTYEATGTTVSVWVAPASNLSNYLASGYSVTTENGFATFADFQLRAPPGIYNLSYYALPIGESDPSLYIWSWISVEIRPCKLGEYTDDSGEECFECSGPDNYGLNPANTSCDSCPEYAACNFNGSRVVEDTKAPSRSASSNSSRSSETVSYGFLVPIDGYWHSSPFSPQMHQCPTPGACTYVNRSNTLGQWQETGLSEEDTALPPPNTSVLYDISSYWQLQCATGYTGRLCGQCESPKYGWRSSGRCYRCPARGVNALYYILSYTLTIALLAWTVRATLGRSLGESRALLVAVQSTGRMTSYGHGRRLPNDNDEIVFVADSEYGSDGGRDASGSRRGGGSTADGGFLAVDADRSTGSSSSRRDISGSACSGVPGCGGVEFSGRSRVVSGTGCGGSSKRASCNREGGDPPRFGGIGGGSRPATGSDDGAGGQGSRKSGGGILEMAAAAAMAQLEAKTECGGDGSDHEDVDAGGDGYVYGNGGSSGSGGFAGRLSGSDGASGSPLLVGPRDGSLAQLQPAVLPGLRPRVGTRVPRSVLARESRLANSSGGGGAAVGGAEGAAAAGGDDGDGSVPWPSDGCSDASDGEHSSAAAARRHRLSRMSRAAGREEGSGGGEGSGGSGRNRSGSSVAVAAAAATAALGGPVTEGILSDGGHALNGGGGTAAAGGDVSSTAARNEGMRRRKHGEAGPDGGADENGRRGGVSWGRQGDGTNSGAGHGGGDGRISARLNPVTSRRRHRTALRAQLKEDELQREEKPPHAVVLKIIVNFLQVTSVARNLNLDFPDSIDKLWSVGSMGSSAMTTLVSIDCSFPDNGVSKAIQRTVLYVAIPWIFILLSVPLWVLLYVLSVRRRRRAQPAPAAAAPASIAASVAGTAPATPAALMPAPTTLRETTLTEVVSSQRSLTEKEAQRQASQKMLAEAAPATPRSGDGLELAELAAAAAASHGGGNPVAFVPYMITRMVVTTLIIIFYFYPSVTDTILSIFQCDRLDDDTGPYAAFLRSIGYFWELDYDLSCFRSAHLGLTLAVGLPGLAGWCVGVPTGSGLWLRASAAGGRLNQPEFSDRFGFLYEDYRRSAYYWESVIMARKLLVVGLLLLTNSSEDIMQVLVVMGVVVVAGLLHLYVRPYEKDRFNSLESTSLGSTLLILYLCCFFLLDDLGERAKQALSVLILLVNVATLSYFVYCLATEVWRYGIRILDANGDGRVSRGELLQWLNLTLGGPLSRLVTWIASPRWRRRRRRHGGGGGSSRGGGDAGSPGAPVGLGGGSSAGRSVPPPSPLVVLSQPSLSPPPSKLPLLALPPQPPPPHWIASPPSALPVQLKLPPPAPLQLPLPPPLEQQLVTPSTVLPPPPQLLQQQQPQPDPHADAAAAAPLPRLPGGGEQLFEPVYESYTAVQGIHEQHQSPVSSSAPSPPATDGGGGSGGPADPYGTRRHSCSPFAELPAALARRGPSGASLATGGAAAATGGGGSYVDVEGGGLAGTTAVVMTKGAALLPQQVSLPGAAPEREPRDVASAAEAVAATGGSRRGSRQNIESSSAGASGGTAAAVAAGYGPRTTAALAREGDKSGSPVGGRTAGGGGGAAAAASNSSTGGSRSVSR